MKNFIDKATGQLYAYDDDCDPIYILDGLDPLTDTELSAIVAERAAVLSVVDYQATIQRHMDEAARAAGYDDIKAAVTYADEPAVPRFQAEGQAFRTWRSLCWAYGYEQLAAVEAGTRPQPTVAQFLAELPPLDLPQQ